MVNNFFFYNYYINERHQCISCFTNFRYDIAVEWGVIEIMKCIYLYVFGT